VIRIFEVDYLKTCERLEWLNKVFKTPLRISSGQDGLKFNISTSSYQHGVYSEKQGRKSIIHTCRSKYIYPVCQIACSIDPLWQEFAFNNWPTSKLCTRRIRKALARQIWFNIQCNYWVIFGCDLAIVNYKRSAIGQKGGGHISPLGAYDEISDSFLVLDVNPASSWLDLDKSIHPD